MNFTTTLAQLSGILQQKLSTITAANLLSAIQQLSGVPIHPYEQVKHFLFGSNHTFSTIDDLELPENFCPRTFLCELTGITHKTNQMNLCALSCVYEKSLSGVNISDTPFTVDREFLKKNLEFVEVVKTVTMADIKSRPIEVMQKLTSFYIKNCK